MGGSCWRAGWSSSSVWSARAMTRFARRSGPGSAPVTAMSELGTALKAASNGSAPVQAKAGRHKETTLYQALAGAGAGDGRSLAELREAALKAFDASELPVWR